MKRIVNIESILFEEEDHKYDEQLTRIEFQDGTVYWYEGWGDNIRRLRRAGNNWIEGLNKYQIDYYEERYQHIKPKENQIKQTEINQSEPDQVQQVIEIFNKTKNTIKYPLSMKLSANNMLNILDSIRDKVIEVIESR